ncbi:integrase core domain-containing protein [Streptomyces sp. NPDC058286]|uniref:integrase core domain-containing protein n=1 Tax=Streptomyces sp. NPDC058286 TaxID=3346422 RepID=UPI0036EAEDB7
MNTPNTDLGPSPASAASSGSHGRWARSAPAPTTQPASFHASLQRETLQGAHDYGDSDTCRRTVFAWLTRYNTRRRHSANGHLSPNEYEHRHHTAKLTLAA